MESRECFVYRNNKKLCWSLSPIFTTWFFYYNAFLWICAILNYFFSSTEGAKHTLRSVGYRKKIAKLCLYICLNNTIILTLIYNTFLRRKKWIHFHHTHWRVTCEIYDSNDWESLYWIIVWFKTNLKNKFFRR